MSIENLKEKEFLIKINEAKTLAEIESLKSEIFGKNGLMTHEFKKLGSLPEEKRKDFAKKLNELKSNFINLIDDKIFEFETLLMQIFGFIYVAQGPENCITMKKVDFSIKK